MIRLTRIICRSFSSNIKDRLTQLSPDYSQLKEKAKNLQEAQPYFDRLMTFDADMLSFIPFFFKPLEPFIMGVKNLMIHANQFVGLPTWALIMASCLFIRALLFPLVLVQVKRVGRLAPIAPVFVHLKNTYKDSQLPKSRKLWLATKAVIGIVRAQKLKFFRVWIYTLMNIPIIITMVYAIRQVISDPQFGNQGFLYFSDLMMTDPYGLLPFLTIALYYWNFQRFITKQNAHTLMSKIRGICQVLLILWFPFLCYWPSGIVLYMFANALLSVLQTTLMTRQTFNHLLSSKTIMYNYMLSIVELQQNKSKAMIESIRSGDESHAEKAISEELLVKQTEDMIIRINEDLNKEDYEDEKENKEQPK